MSTRSLPLSLDADSRTLEPFMACIEPAYWTTIMPITVRSNFNRTMLTGGNVSYVNTTWEYILYDNSDPTQLPTGDIYIELSTGFNITIPRSEWIFPATAVNLTEGRWDIIPGNCIPINLVSWQ